MQNWRKYLLVRITNFLLLCPLFLIQTDRQPIDNLSIFNNMTSTVARGIVDRLSPDSSAAIFIRSLSQQHAGNWLIENWLVKSLYQRGISKIYLEKQDSNSAFVIHFQIDSLGVEYLPTGKKNLVERRFKLNLAVRALEGSSGLVTFFQEFSEQYTDSVKIIDVKGLENKDFPFTQSDLPVQRGLKRFSEPFIVITTTAGIIYLFFRLRSN
jgi:hypothetical protein